ncbi:MAG: hypothetical protein KDB14_07415 [Planctomycetales bacterium]|nr:hypothetical protein [Planctomycetales bacterium]
MMEWLGRLLGLKDVQSIDSASLALTAPWTHGAAFWVLLGCLALFLAGMAFYLRNQRRGPGWLRTALGFARGGLLALILLTLAAPVLRLQGKRVESPVLYLVFDGTESMELSDDYGPEQMATLQRLTATDPSGATRRTLLQGWLRESGADWLEEFQQRGVQIEPFLFDGRTTSRLRRLRIEAGDDGRAIGARLAEQLTATGQVTELGAALDDVQRQFGAGRLAGVVFFSDFAHNGSSAPLGQQGAVSRLTATLHTVGLGATEAADLRVELQTDPKMKRAERTNLTARISQAGLDGQAAVVTMIARPLEGDRPPEEVGKQTVTLDGPLQLVEFPYTPEASGEFEFEVNVAPLEGEATEANNQFVRRTKVIDDYLRLMYTAYEPTWEWHFLKEVFHRDKLVGMDGFRTFLSSSDPKVRQSNVLFLPALTPPRAEFFRNDVIFLDDMPRTAITERYGEMVREFVAEHGGGLVIIAGPRFGPRQLAGTPLADMLPVTIDPNAKLKDDREFALRLTPHASRYPFMTLGDNEPENLQAWSNLSRVPFYQPVLGLHEQATALAEHPVDLCQDGRTKQPLIAIRPFGRGEVVYLGFNETWRLRRRFGEKHYRRLWSQLIYRLGMSHALGADKRFRVAINGQQFRPDDEVTLTVEAYDENYEPLDPADLPDGSLEVQLQTPGQAGLETRSLNAAFLRKGVYEARFPVYEGGQHLVSVKDPVTGSTQQRRFEVVRVSAEQLRVVRDEHLQQQLAKETGGTSVDLASADRLLDAINARPTVEPMSRDHPLWATPLWFSLLMTLMLGEWLIRKWIHLT